MHMLHSDDDDKEDRWEKLPAAVVPSDCREMGEGEEVKARWNKWVMPKGDEDDSARSTPACSERSDQNPFAQWETNP